MGKPRPLDYGRRSDIGPYAIIPEWVINAPISDRAFRLYNILARYANNDSEAWPFRSTLAERLACSTSTIDRVVTELEAIRAVTVTGTRRADGGRGTNMYIVHQVPPSPPVTSPPLTHDEGPLSTGDESINESQIEREPSKTAEPQLGLDVPHGTDEDRAEKLQQRSAAGRALRETGKGRPRRRTPRDDLYDALVAAFGPASTPSRQRFYGRTVSQLMAAGATPAQVQHARIVMSRRGWDNPSPEALVKHWDELTAEPAGPSNPAARKWWENQ